MAFRFVQNQPQHQNLQRNPERNTHNNLNGKSSNYKETEVADFTSTTPRLTRLTQLLKKVQLSRVPLWQGFSQAWDLSSFRTKLALILVSTAALPVVVTTQGVVEIAKQRLVLEMQESLKTNLNLLEQEVGQVKSKNENTASSLAEIVKTTELDPKNKEDKKVIREILKDFTSQKSEQSGQSFQILTRVSAS